jgi:hypothetical protein
MTKLIPTATLQMVRLSVCLSSYWLTELFWQCLARVQRLACNAFFPTCRSVFVFPSPSAARRAEWAANQHIHRLPRFLSTHSTQCQAQLPCTSLCYSVREACGDFVLPNTIFRYRTDIEVRARSAAFLEFFRVWPV